VVSGIAATGITTITYKVSSTSCYTTRLFTVALSASVTGTPDICAGNSSLFTHPFAGGIWYSSNPSVATVGTSGLVTGVAPGTSTISYSLSTTGCDAAKSVTVNSTPVAISGASIVWLYHTVILTGTPAGGTWSSSDVSKVTVDASSGIVTGVSNGTATIMYSATTTCTGSTTSVVTTSSSGNCVSGVGDPFALAKELRIFPNPNKGTFSLDVPGTIDEEAHIIVTNIVGEKVKEFDLTTNAVNNVSLGQPAGVYFLSATTLNSKYFVKIVVE
jgi:hypothetical protein